MGYQEPPARTFKDLLVWKRAHRFVLDVYRVTGQFPGEEKFGLTSQLRRAAVSIPANIAEGFGKFGSADKARFINIAQGSVNECSYYLMLAKDLGYMDESGISANLTEIHDLLKKYHSKIKFSQHTAS